ncbi:recombinase family protein [Streptomyces sp. NPDC006692]|uniref:recombinase family protein n=1 Tax=unclassified Streptomyces TaxID=2593676 RepID=UPI0036BBE01A
MIMDEAIALRGGRQVTTDLYALGIEPTNSFLRARSHAEGRGWTVGRKFSDPYSSPDPTPRPGWSRLCDRVASGRAQGVIVIGQSDITPDDSEFEITLHWFREHGAFVDFVLAPRPLPAQTPSNEHQAPLAHP